MSKSKVVMVALLASAPVLLFFQNCAQQGSLGVSNSTTSQKVSSSSDALMIVPPQQINSNHDSAEGGMVQIDRPVLHEGDTVAAQQPAADDSSVSKCNQINISDILLQVASISANCANPNDVDFEVVDSNRSISLDKLTLKVKALKNSRVQEVFLRLNAEGNKILSTDNVAMDLKTPSAQSSGLKIKLASALSVEQGKNYVLELAINPSEQIVSNKNKCIFRPIVREAALKSL